LFLSLDFNGLTLSTCRVVVSVVKVIIL